MPILILERIPLPSLQTYATFSIFMLTCALFYSYQIVRNAPLDFGHKEPIEKPRTSNVHDPEHLEKYPNDSPRQYSTGKLDNALDVLHVLKRKEDVSTLKEAPPDDKIHSIQDGPEYNGWNGTLPYNNSFFNIIYVITTEVWGVWTLINTAYCCLIFFGKLIQMVVFGELRVIEQQHLRDRFWNFVFYKFIFIFGVMNVQTMEEVVMWVAWFTSLGFFNLLTQLAKDRFEYVSSSPTTTNWVHIKILSLLFFILSSVSGLMVICVMVGYHAGYSIFTFMAAECVLLSLKTLYVVARYVIHLWDMNLEGIWENRSVFVYYAELMFELTSLFVDFAHHLHMLLWGNIFLSMASLVICMHLRYLVYEFQRRFRRHKNYLTVLHNVESRFVMATVSELEQNSDHCAICWEKMEAARKLPCCHLFHNSCLRSWLEQDTSCPTCRVSLSQQNGAAGDAGADSPGLPPPPINASPPVQPNVPFTNHFFHFDASRYVSWLPSFSVEVTHTHLLNTGAPDNRVPVQSSLLDNMVHQVNSIFPQTPMNAVIEDLQVTQSVDQTIENILEGRVASSPSLTLPSTVSSTGARAIQAQLSQAREAMSGETTDETMTDASTAQTTSTEESSQFHEETPSTSGGRFSKSSYEREAMLRQRKAALLEAARKQYLSVRETSNQTP